MNLKRCLKQYRTEQEEICHKYSGVLEDRLKHLFWLLVKKYPWMESEYVQGNGGYFLFVEPSRRIQGKYANSCENEVSEIELCRLFDEYEGGWRPLKWTNKDEKIMNEIIEISFFMVDEPGIECTRFKIIHGT